MPRGSWGFQWKTRPSIRHPGVGTVGLKTRLLGPKSIELEPLGSVNRRLPWEIQRRSKSPAPPCNTGNAAHLTSFGPVFPPPPEPRHNSSRDTSRDSKIMGNCKSEGYGSKFNQGTANYSPFHLPGYHLGAVLFELISASCPSDRPDRLLLPRWQRLPSCPGTIEPSGLPFPFSCRDRAPVRFHPTPRPHPHHGSLRRTSHAWAEGRNKMPWG